MRVCVFVGGGLSGSAINPCSSPGLPGYCLAASAYGCHARSRAAGDLESEPSHPDPWLTPVLLLLLAVVWCAVLCYAVPCCCVAAVLSRRVGVW